MLHHYPTPRLAGIGEATGGSDIAAIGHAVAQALGTRLRDLPMTRERVITALLKT